jgi:hypothetical protein
LFAPDWLELMNLDQGIVDTYIDRAVEEFDANPLSTQIIRRFAHETPHLFAVAAIRHLATTLQSEYITDPGKAQWRCISLYERTVAIDCSLEVKLARRLPDRLGINHHEAFEGGRSARTLDILDRTSRGRRLLPIVGHLVESADPRTREKAILFIGRRIQSPRWAEKQLKNSDGRIRANAIESIWGLNSREATSLLETCAADASNRVMGNALVGLYIAGRQGITDHVKSMAIDPGLRFRSTAAWVMGKIDRPEFVPLLTELFRDEQPQVRGAALRSLIGIRRSEANTPEALQAKAARVAELTPGAAAELVEQAAQAVGEKKEFELRMDGTSFSSRRR